MNNNEEIRSKDLLRLNHFSSKSSADNALHKIRKAFDIPPYGKVFWWQYVTIYNSGVSLIKLIEIYNKANGDYQWKQLKHEISKTNTNPLANL